MKRAMTLYKVTEAVEQDENRNRQSAERADGQKEMFRRLDEIDLVARGCRFQEEMGRQEAGKQTQEAYKELL